MKKWALIVGLILIAGFVISFLPIREGFARYSSELVTVKAFYGNSILDPELTCDKVFPVERVVPKKSTIEFSALEALFKGPTKYEQENGYFMSNRPEAGVKGVDVRRGTAYVDFDRNFNGGVGGSCQVIAMRAEVEATLKQFPDVQNVVISVEGETEGILEP